MLDLLVTTTLILAVAVGWFGVVRLIRSVRHTSLTSAAGWAVWFQVTLTVTTIATLCKSRVSPGILDQLWYLTAVSALCPFVAVLGARRGRLLEWSFFIVLPLIVVLEWPALAQLSRCWHGQRLELETPALIGYGIVMLMCLGTYFFSSGRFSVAVGFWTSSWSIYVFATLIPRKLDDWHGTHQKSILTMAIIQLIFWGIVAAASKHTPRHFGWNRVWIDFRDWFGVAWATRIMGRVNEVAQHEQWPWRLTPNGIQQASPDAPNPGSPDSDPRVGHTFRWLLKPFVDPEWIDERLRTDERKQLPERSENPPSAGT